jgi:hypothetical protein
LALLEDLLKLADDSGRGPPPSFNRPILLLAFLLIGDSGVIGRQALAARSGLGEGATRTILRKLKGRRLTSTSASGVSLTGAGRQTYDSIRETLSGFASLHGSHLSLGRSQVAAVVRGRAASVKGGIEQRDSAIKAGASGATTYVFERGKFAIPGGSRDCEADFPSASWKKLRKSLSPRDGDAIVLCGAELEHVAVLGALAASLSLL